MSNTYTYTETDRLITKEHYHYTPWHGIQFLTDYFENRCSFLKKIGLSYMPISNNSPLHNISEKYGIEGLCTTPTSKKLLELIDDTSRDSEWIERLLQRFEVSKRIYSDYDENFKPKSKLYEQLINYILFALILLSEQQNSDNYRYLNTALKLNDLVISTHEKTLEKELKALINISILFELYSVQCLIEKCQIHEDY